MIPTRVYRDRDWREVKGTQWHWDGRHCLCGEGEKHVFLNEICLFSWDVNLYYFDNNSQIELTDGEALYIIEHTIEPNRRMKRVVWRNEYSIIVEVT